MVSTVAARRTLAPGRACLVVIARPLTLTSGRIRVVCRKLPRRPTLWLWAGSHRIYWGGGNTADDARFGNCSRGAARLTGRSLVLSLRTCRYA
jgi:hypothetical protein